jgi:hypothetical protein
MDDKNPVDPDPRRRSAIARWLASFPLTIVAANSLFIGLILSVCEAAGWIDWGHEALLVAIVPVTAWAVATWFVDRH